MKAYRYVGREPVELDLTGIHAGRTAFLVGGSPTLMRQDWRRLEARHVLTFGMNNVGKVVRCSNILFGDTPECYYGSVLGDISATRFARHCYADAPNGRGGKWRDDPSMLFFNHRPGFPTAADISGPRVVAERNALAMSMFILLSFGVKRVVLCGSTFDAGSYSTGSRLGVRERNWNSLLYSHQVEWLKRMSGLMEEIGVELVDTSVMSKLQGVCRTMTLSAAIDMYAPDPPPDAKDVPHCIQVPGYGEVKEEYTRRFVRPERDDCPVVTGVSFGRDGCSTEQGAAYFTLALLFLDSMADTNPGRRILFLVDEPAAREFIPVARRLLAGRKPKVSFHVVGMDAIRRIGFSGHLGFMSNARLHLHRMFPDLGRCMWIDADAIVRSDLSQLAMAGAANAAAGHPVSGVKDRYITQPNWLYVNAGILYMDLNAIRALPNDPADTPPARDSLFDQTVVNRLDPGGLDARWNVYFSPKDAGRAKDSPGLMELFDTAYIVHFVGDKVRKYADPSGNPATGFLFTWIRSLVGKLGAGSFPIPGVWRDGALGDIVFKESTNEQGSV